MKKALLVTLRTGGGHDYAAASLETRLKEKGFETVRIDPFKENDKILDILISGGYKTMAKRTPFLYGRLYRIADKELINKNVGSIIKLKCRKKLLKIIENENPDIIISTHPILTFILGKLKIEKRISLPLMAVVTDFEAHQTYFAWHKEIDAYITGSIQTMQNLIKKGVQEERVFAYGIPIRQEFYLPKDESQKDGVFTVLLMGGSMGTRLMSKVMTQLVKMPEYLRIIAVCGNDAALKEKLDKKYGGKGKEYNKDIKIYGFINEIAKLMDASDLMISKPGGLTVSEALAKKIPMLIPYLIPGQEEENADLLESQGAAIKIKHIRRIGHNVSLLMENPHLLEMLRENMQVISKSHSIDAIVEKAVELASRRMPLSNLK